MITHYLSRTDRPDPAIVPHRPAPRSNWLARTLCRLGLHDATVWRTWHTYSHRGSPIIAREYRCSRCEAGWTRTELTKRNRR